MASVSSDISLDGGVAEASYRSQDWFRVQFNERTATIAQVMLGDPVSGPALGFNTVTPSNEEIGRRRITTAPTSSA